MKCAFFLALIAVPLLTARPSWAAWPEKLHLLPAAGLHTSLLDSRLQENQAGLGTSLSANVGYFFVNETALEVCTSVSFNRVNDLLIWDTLFGIGFRSKLPFFKSTESSAPYIRAFIGRGPAVAVFVDGRPSPYRELGAQRIQFEGPAGGIGIGVFRKSPSGLTWFIEALATVHTFDTFEVIKSDKDVPVIISEADEDDEEYLANLHITVGLVAF